MAERDDVARDLVALGRMTMDRAVQPPTTGLETAVMERVARLPRARRTAPWWSRDRRRLALVVAAVLLALLATPPVRAAVADWFGFGAVRVERGDSPGSRPSSAPPPTIAPGTSLTEAAGLIGFPIAVPEELGEPDGVGISSGRASVSMSWTTTEAGVLRLDQFDARLDYAVVKQTPGVLYTEVAGRDAIWFEEPHEVALLDDEGAASTHAPRVAGHTLIWQDGDVTLRLEGDVTLERAVEIAESTVPVG